MSVLEKTRPYGVLLTNTTAIYVAHRKYATPTDFAVAADWTPVNGDVKIALDGDVANNITNLPTYVTDKGWKYILTGAELTCQQAVVRIADAATKAITDFSFTVETFDNNNAMYAPSSASNPVYARLSDINGDTTAVTNLLSALTGGGFAFTGSTIGLVANAISSGTFAADAITAAAIAADAIDASALKADAVTEIQSGLATSSGIPTTTQIRDAVWAKTMTELASIPGVTGSVLEALEFLFLLSRNKITQTSTTTTLRNDADSASIGTSTVSDDGTTATRGKFS